MSEPVSVNDIDKLAASVDALVTTITESHARSMMLLEAALSRVAASPVQNVAVSAPPPRSERIALWVVVTCCVVMLTAMVPMAAGLYWVAMDSRDRGHQMNALYMSVPGLRELVERQITLIDKTSQQEQQP